MQSQVGSYIINFKAANEKASTILNEDCFCRTKIKEEFPILPDPGSNSIRQMIDIAILTNIHNTVH
jgi:hypothetical protein